MSFVVAISTEASPGGRRSVLAVAAMTAAEAVRRHAGGVCPREDAAIAALRAAVEREAAGSGPTIDWDKANLWYNSDLLVRGTFPLKL